MRRANSVAENLKLAAPSGRSATRLQSGARARRLQLVSLKRFFWLTYIASASFETGVLFEECERNFADRPVALLGDDQLGFAGLFHPRFFIFLVKFWPNK